MTSSWRRKPTPSTAAVETFVALKATVCKAELAVNDLCRHYYQHHSLTIARHPSETDERMMLRLLAFALHADDDLEFGRGLSAVDEPALWRRDPSGTISLWLDLGTPDPKRLRKACGRAEQVWVLAYGGQGLAQWSQQIEPERKRFANLTVKHIAHDSAARLAALADRNMQLQCTVDGDDIWVDDGLQSLAITLTG